MAIKTTKHVGLVKRYSSVAGRTKNLRLYKFVEIGDDYLTDVEVDISLDQIPHAHKIEKPVTLYLTEKRGLKGSLGMGLEGKFYSSNRDMNKMAQDLTTPVILTFIVFLISISTIGYAALIDGQGTPFDNAIPLIFGLIIAIITGLMLLGSAADALIVAPLLRKTQIEVDKMVGEAEKEGFSVVKV